jgi:hypothetical protein
MKTIKQAAEEYANTKAKVVVSGTEITNTIDDLNLYSQTDFEAGVKFAQEWISVKDELPPIEIWINLKLNDADYKSIIFSNIELVKTLSKTFTHWRPIEME